jgi:hypothetical protein
MSYCFKHRIDLKEWLFDNTTRNESDFTACDLSKIIPEFQDIPASQIYKFFIDENRWAGSQNDPQVFDRKEPGYMKAMQEAFRWGMSQRERRWDSIAICVLHERAVRDVKDKKSDGAMESLRLGYRLSREELKKRNEDETNEKFGLKKDTMSLEGCKELVAKYKDKKYAIQFEGDPNSYHIFQLLLEHPAFSFMKKDEKGQLIPRDPDARDTKDRPFIVQKLPGSECQIKTCVDALLDIYYRDIKTAKNEEEQLKVIALLVQNLDQIHPFYDGNIRTFGILLLNFLLIQNGFSPTCLSDPNCIDYLSIDEVVEKIKEGQENFAKLKNS